MSIYLKSKIRHQILIAEDDADDRELLQEAFQEANENLELKFVQDGEELMEYLLQLGRYEVIKPQTPSLILLDLNMPKKDGREVLQIIKQTPALAYIPVLVLSTSQSHDDIIRTYKNGGNGFISKPSTYKTLVAMAININKFWFEIARIP